MAGSKVLLLFVLCTILPNQAETVTVTTSKGVVNGFRADYGTDQTQLYYGSADVFLGIPYAEPPVGPLRFQPPKSKTAWNSPLNAISYDSFAQCPQPPNVIATQNASEDCLYLNVFSPNVNTVSSASKYPVMVWIHGGAFVIGNTQRWGLKGIVRNLVSRGVVIVTLQYRLGLLGFFTTKTSDFPANLGLLDQVMALQWIKEEITAFGGDASQVTIFGVSAGGMSVSAHTYSPLSKGLFQKAIMQSGTTLMGLDGTLGYKHVSEMRAMQLCNFTSSQWATRNFTSLKLCMQSMPYKKFTDLETKNPGKSANVNGWQIVKDDYFLPGFPRDLAANRSNIPILIGTNRDEWSFFQIVDLRITNMTSYTKQFYQQQRDQFTAFYEDNRSVIRQMIDSIYVAPLFPVPDPVNDNLAWFKIISQVVTDSVWASLTAREVDFWRRINNNPNVFLYEYVYPANAFRLNFNLTWIPVFHTEELVYIFMRDASWENNQLVSAEDFALANFFGQTWTDFAKTGKPGWNPVTSDSPYQYMEIDVNSSMKQSYRETARVFWNDVVPALAGVYPRDPGDGTSQTAIPRTMTTTSCKNPASFYVSDSKSKLSSISARVTAASNKKCSAKTTNPLPKETKWDVKKRQSVAEKVSSCAKPIESRKNAKLEAKRTRLDTKQAKENAKQADADAKKPAKQGMFIVRLSDLKSGAPDVVWKIVNLKMLQKYTVVVDHPDNDHRLMWFQASDQYTDFSSKETHKFLSLKVLEDTKYVKVFIKPQEK